MNLQICIKHLSLIIAIIGVSMILPILWGVYYHEAATWWFLLTIAIGSLLSGLGYLFTRNMKKTLNRREALFIVGFGWLLTVAFGALPFWFSGSGHGYIDAFFEIVSGFSGTGASILSDVEILPKCILFWRCQTHWLGGMGIVVLFISILPYIGAGGKLLFKAEVSGIAAGGLKPRIKTTALVLCQIFIGLVTLETILLMFGGMNLFDSLCHSFGSVGTGGFSNYNASIGYYDNLYIDLVITFFLIFSATNFGLYFQFMRGKKPWQPTERSLKEKAKKKNPWHWFKENFDPGVFLRDTEYHVFLSIIVVSTALICWNLLDNGIYNSFGKALRYASFQLVSMMTTTGFCTADFDLWPPLSKILLVLVMIIGGCAGSTSGGLKIIRLVILTKCALNRIRSIYQPHKVALVRIGKISLAHNTVDMVLLYFAIYAFVFVLSSVSMTALGLDIVSAVSAVAATLNGVGPGLGLVGATQNYDHIPALGKIILCFCMIVGRLEFFAILILLAPSFWRKK